MESVQKPGLVICISPGINRKWDVSEKGSDAPLISFDEKEDAYAYATQLTRSSAGSAVLVEDEEGFSPLPHGSDRSEGDAAETNHAASLPAPRVSRRWRNAGAEPKAERPPSRRR